MDSIRERDILASRDKKGQRQRPTRDVTVVNRFSRVPVAAGWWSPISTMHVSLVAHADAGQPRHPRSPGAQVSIVVVTDVLVLGVGKAFFPWHAYIVCIHVPSTTGSKRQDPRDPPPPPSPSIPSAFHPEK